ncbi:2-methylcitrate dehydratase [Sulfolobales archaeon HS-7]|nr:2-methylcitrate dehydratase [Sulfolobales archaeon HS-7]
MSLEEELVSSIVNLKDIELEEKIKHEIRRRVLDSLGVAIASSSSPPAEATKRLMNYFPGKVSTITGELTTVDLAGFYNTLLIRYQDFNDTYLSKEPLHPSDMIGGILAVDNAFRITDLYKAIAIAYEVGVSLCDAETLRTKGFDHVNYLQLAETAGLGVALNLTEDEVRNAMAISLVPNVALRETRVGTLSMWKAGAAADAIRKSVFATLAAKSGFTGPEKFLSGKMGFAQLVKGDYQEIAKIKDVSGIERTLMKKYPVEYHAQAAVQISLNIHKKVRPSDINSVTVEIYEAGKTILADPEKWNPTTKETADHSLPFVVAAALVTGDFWLDTYNLIFDEKIRDVMKKVKVEENSEYTKVYPGKLPTKIVVKTASGTTEEELQVPRGHYLDPMSDQEVADKFLRLIGRNDLVERIMKRGILNG